MSSIYFRAFEHRMPPPVTKMSAGREQLWHLLAGLTVGIGAWYLWWRWSFSLNPNAMVFSVAIAAAETLAYIGTLIFFFDIWREGDDPVRPPPMTRDDANLEGDGPIRVDIFIATFDEELEVVEPSIFDAKALRLPPNISTRICVLDDGKRPEFAAMAAEHGVDYFTRADNRGFKAGNLRHAMFRTDGDFILICDADTRLLPGFLENTLGYFRDGAVAWVQTPHWFYDIPEGEPWRDWARRKFGRLASPVAAVMPWLTGAERPGRDPFMSDPALFFDVIQRRRNRNGASFCCGAGSIHRREAIFDDALDQAGAKLDGVVNGDRGGYARAVELQPFRFHVSEDIYTSILLQSNTKTKWRSVLHPQIEARMLSPWSMKAWATQKLKYAGGTFDIMLRANPIFKRGMPWRTKLHYAATFWSYLSIVWVTLMLAAPVFSLFTGLAPVEAYSMEFFAHLLPLLLVNEAAMVTACKGHGIHAGRITAITTLPFQWRALIMVLRGKRPRFPVTPKTPVVSASLRQVSANLAILAVMTAAAIYGLTMGALGAATHTGPFLVVNLFWLAWNALAIGRILTPVLWPPQMTAPTMEEHQNDSASQTA